MYISIYGYNKLRHISDVSIVYCNHPCDLLIYLLNYYFVTPSIHSSKHHHVYLLSHLYPSVRPSVFFIHSSIHPSIYSFINPCKTHLSMHSLAYSPTTLSIHPQLIPSTTLSIPLYLLTDTSTPQPVNQLSIYRIIHVYLPLFIGLYISILTCVYICLSLYLTCRLFCNRHSQKIGHV